MQESNKAEFKTHVLESVKGILALFDDKLLYQAIKPVINLALPKLEDMVNKEPAEVYKYLKMAEKHISEAVRLYEAEK